MRLHLLQLCSLSYFILRCTLKMLFPPFKKICIFSLETVRSRGLFSEETLQYHEFQSKFTWWLNRNGATRNRFHFFWVETLTNSEINASEKLKASKCQMMPADIDKLKSLRCLSQDNLENKHSERPFYWILCKWGIVANEKCIYDCRILSPGFPASSKAPRKILISTFIGKRWAREVFHKLMTMSYFLHRQLITLN